MCSFRRHYQIHTTYIHISSVHNLSVVLIYADCANPCKYSLQWVELWARYYINSFWDSLSRRGEREMAEGLRTSPGLDAITAALLKLYPDQTNPLQMSSVVKYW